MLAILCLTLGIGANAAVFSWIEGILFRPFPLVATRSGLLRWVGTARGRGSGTLTFVAGFPGLAEELHAGRFVHRDQDHGHDAESWRSRRTYYRKHCIGELFDAIGVRPILGRGFVRGEDVGSNAHPVTVISYQLWQSRFKVIPQSLARRSA